MKLNIVRIESIRHFDDCEYSYLPYFNEIFGVYRTNEEAVKAIWEYFGDDKYEAVYDDEIKDNECPYCDELFKYEDKEYGGIAYYGIFYHEETLNE